MKKIFLTTSYFILVFSILGQINIPTNSSDKTSVNKWIIAKVNDSIDIKKIIESEDYFKSISKEKIKKLNLSKFDNVTFSLYQIFDEINFNNTFIISSKIESKTEFKYSFIYSNVDMASEIYINGQKAKIPFGNYNLNFEHLLKKGKNSIIIIGKPNGNYKSRFNLKINDKKLSKIKVKILKKNLEPYKNGFFGLKNEKMFRVFNLDKNGEYTIYVNPGNYLIGSNYSEFYKWSSEFNISENQEKEIKLILNQHSRISGNISTFDGKNPHPGINVSLVNASSNKIFGISVTDKSGNYSFDPPNGDWYVKVSSKHSDDIYFSNNGKKSIFKITNSTKPFENINFEIPTQINTSWGKVTMFDGMLSNSIIKSIISKKDILYFATFNGLSVYDGLTVKNYNYINGLPNDPIRAIFEDSNGYIWLGYATMGLIQWKDGEIINHFTNKDGLPSNIIGAINEDNEGNILIGTNKGLAVLENKKFTNYNFTSGIGDGNIQCITVIGNNIWIGTGNGLSIFSKGIIKPINIKTFSNLTWGGYYINVIKKDNDNNIWLGTASGLIKYDGVKFKFYSIFDGLTNNSIIDIHVDENSLLIGTQTGLCRFKDNQFNTIISLEKEGLKGVRISSIDKTKDGMYFISTNMNGVFFYDPNSINTITANEGFEVAETVNDIKVDKDGVIWAGAINGLYKIENGIITNYYNKSNSNMPRNLVLDLEIDSDGSMWLVQQNHITRFYENNFENMTKKIGISNTQVIDLEFDNDGTMWIGTTSGLGKFKNDSLTIYKESDGLVRPLFSSANVSQPCAVTIGKNNEVIYSTYGSGFSIFNGLKFINFSTKNGLANDKVEEIAVDSKNNYWIALDGSGVQMYNGKNFISYTMENGLSSDESYTIYVDDFDKVFVGSWHGGVNYFNGEIWNSLDSRDGLINNTVKSLYGINGNKYWFGSYGGITSYEPKIQTPYIKISSIETPNGFYNNLKDLKNNNQKFVSDTRSKFTLNSTSFNTKKEKQKYLIKITRKNKTESLIISSNEYVFHPKKTGKYILEFQSVDRDMNYSTPLKVNISVVGPWYKNMATAIPILGVPYPFNFNFWIFI